VNTRHFIKLSYFWKKTVATWIYCQVCSTFTWVDVCSTQLLCRGIQSAFCRVTHQRPRRRRRRRVYFGPFRNNPENNGVDQIVTRPCAQIYNEIVAARPHAGAEKRINSTGARRQMVPRSRLNILPVQIVFDLIDLRSDGQFISKRNVNHVILICQ